MRYLLDSNILIGFLNGDRKIAEWLSTQTKEESWLSISFITKIEVLSSKELKDSEIDKTKKFLDIFNRSYFNEEIIDIAAMLRRKSHLSLGDVIITATAINGQYILVTNDKNLTKKMGKFMKILSI